MERGIGTSRGIGIGHVLIVYNASAVVNRGTHYNADEEKKRGQKNIYRADGRIII